MVPKPPSLVGKAGEVGAQIRTQKIVAMAVGDEQDDTAAGHAVTPLIAASKISHTRAPVAYSAA